MKTRSNSLSLVSGQHRTAKWVPVLGLAAIGLALTLGLLWLAHPASAPVSDWRWLRLGWLAGLAVTVLGVALLWRTRRRTLLRSAAEMDATLDTHNRLEAATALQTAQDAMAKAQRAETEQYLQQSGISRRRPWLPALAVLVALLAMAHIATLICWARPVHEDAKAKQSAPAVAEKKAAPAAPTASIDWVSPDSETAATAIEEVPLEAQAESSTGMRKAVLDIEVNGVHRLSQPLDNQPLDDDLTKPGAHTLKASIYLDQLDVKTYDIVSYHLSAQRITPAVLPLTVSPVQFVQVKPVREDTFVCAGGDQPSKCFNYVTALKAAQLRLMKDNFTLANSEVSHDDSDWLDQNNRVGTEQNNLASRTDDVVTMMTTNHYPEQILDLVRQSQPLMTDAGGKISHQENQPALQPQGQALGYLTEVEKYLKSSIKLAGRSIQPKAADPFQRPKNLELKTHPLTRAGKIDALAQAQSQLAGDLASGSTNSTVKAPGDDPTQMPDLSGSPGERQQKIKDQIGSFLDDPQIMADALKHLQSSDTFAGQSQWQIDQSDYSAASEPAAEAARELHQTAAALRAGGNQAAANKLADALLQLSAAAGNVRRAPQAKSDADAAAQLKQTQDAIQKAANELAAEAQRQQDLGATNAAARLDLMAKQLQSESLKQALAQAQASPRDPAQTEALAKQLDDLAERAGQQRNPGPMSRQELARLVDRMQRTQANLKNLATQASGQCNNPGSSSGSGSGVQMAATKPANSQAGGSSGAPTAADRARGPELSRDQMQRAEGSQLLDELRLDTADARGVTSDLVYVKKLDDVLRTMSAQPEPLPNDYAKLVLQIDPPLTGVINSLQTELAGMRRPFELASKESVGAPPAYREAVADYFEQISRDYQPADAGHNDTH